MIATIVPTTTSPMAVLQAAFRAFLPTIQDFARRIFRSIRCPHTREDCIAETVALSWQAFVGLVRRGKDVRAYVNLLTLCAAIAVLSGRRLTGAVSTHDALAVVPRQYHRLVLEYLGDDAPASDSTSELTSWQQTAWQDTVAV